jgi:hypothetical protein
LVLTGALKVELNIGASRDVTMTVDLADSADVAKLDSFSIS